MENEKLTYINSRGERLELGVDSVYHCNISKDVEGISGVTSVIYSTNSMGQHGDTYVGQRIEARDIDVVGHINTRDKAQALELRRRMLKIFNPELSATLVYEYGGFKRVIDCRAYGEPKILKKEVLYEFDLQIECLNPFWREEEERRIALNYQVNQGDLNRNEWEWCVGQQAEHAQQNRIQRLDEKDTSRPCDIVNHSPPLQQDIFQDSKIGIQ